MNIKNQYVLKGQQAACVKSSASKGSSAQRSRSIQKGSRKNAPGQLRSGKFTVRRTISASSYMIRVAQAKTPTQVGAVIRTAQADLRFVKTCNTDSSGQEQASRIINRVIAKSRLKISRLRNEENLELRRKLVGRKIRREITEELRKKRRRRKAQEKLDAQDPERVTLEKHQEYKEYDEYDEPSQAELAALENTAGLLELAGETAAALPMGDAAAAGAEACGSVMDISI